MTIPTVRLWHLYPREMNIYADRGNIAVLTSRLRWRGFELELYEGGPGEVIPKGGVDLVYLGGGQDRDQLTVASDLSSSKRHDLRALLGDGAVGLFVCGGYQLAGHSYRTAGVTSRDTRGGSRSTEGDISKSVAGSAAKGCTVEGLGVLDITTTAEPIRLIGDIVLESNLGPGDQPAQLVGYENHAGRTTLAESARALGRVLVGHGNNGRDRSEGAVANRTVGTYLHGPLLPKNPWLADLLLSWALEHRYGRSFDLDPLEDQLEQAADKAAKAAVARANRRR